jgi:hypothetical protein
MSDIHGIKEWICNKFRLYASTLLILSKKGKEKEQMTVRHYMPWITLNENIIDLIMIIILLHNPPIWIKQYIKCIEQGMNMTKISSNELIIIHQSRHVISQF